MMWQIQQFHNSRGQVVVNKIMSGHCINCSSKLIISCILLEIKTMHGISHHNIEQNILGCNMTCIVFSCNSSQEIINVD